LRPVEERFEFTNREWVEIAELAERVPSISLSSAGHFAECRAAPSALHLRYMGDELRVLAALNRVGADLGDPIEISRAGRDVLVTGVGIGRQRQQEIHDALSSQNTSSFVFPSRPRPAPSVSAGTRSRTTPPVSARDQARLAEQIGGRVYFAQLAAQVLDLSEPMMSRPTH